MSIKCKKLGYIYGQGTPFEFQALKDVDEGRVQTMGDFCAEMEEKYDLQ